MDAAVSLVQAYLRVNGFFTVTEYPVLERLHDGHLREATDLDLLALRMPGAGRVLPRVRPGQGAKLDLDAALDIDWRRMELIIAEVKEGAGDPNRALLRSGTLREALRRFGVVPRDRLEQSVRDLHQQGQTQWDGHRVRLIIFGAKEPIYPSACRFIPLHQAVSFLETFIRTSRGLGGHRFRDDAVAALSLRDKAMREMRGDAAARHERHAGP